MLRARVCLAVSLICLPWVASAQRVDTLQIGTWSVAPSEVRSVQAVIDCHTGQAVVNLAFEPAGSRRLMALTSGMVGQPLPVRLGNALLVEPHVRSPIAGGQIQISGGLMPDGFDAQAIAERLQVALDLPISPVRPCEPTPNSIVPVR